MDDTLPMITFVVLTTGLCIIALTTLIFSDWQDERRSRKAMTLAPAQPSAAPVRRAAPLAQDFLRTLKRAA